MFRPLLSVCLGLWILTPALSGAATAQGSPGDELAGCWVGRFTVGNRASSVRIGIEPGESAAAQLWIPDMGAGPIPLGRVEAEGGTVKLGQLELERVGPTLRGLLPRSLDPADELRATFRRSPWVESDCESRFEMELETVWEMSIGAGVWAEPLHDRRHRQLVVGTIAGRLVALEAGSGRQRWSLELGASVRSSPVLAAGSVVVAADDGLLRRVDPASGEVLQTIRVAPPLDPVLQPVPGSDFHFRGHQLAAWRDEVLVGTLAGRLLRVSADGTLSELATLGGAVTALEVTGESLFVATLEGSVLALDSEGRIEWRNRAAGPIHGDLLVAGGVLFVGDRGYYLRALDAGSGELLWKRKFFFSWIESSPVLHDGVLFVGSSDAQRISALDPQSGALLWSLSTDGWAWADPRIVRGLVVQGVAGQRGYVATHRPGVLFVDAVTGDLVGRWELEAETEGVAGVVSPPLVVGDVTVVFDVAGGARAWRPLPRADAR